MTDLLGPGDAGASPTLSTTSDVTSPVAGDTWFEDCAGGVSGSGTPLLSKYINRMLQQQRVAIRKSGVPISNAYDNMLSWAIQSGYANWCQPFIGGSVNALSGSAPNAPLQVEGGTVVCGIVNSGLGNTGATTFNWAGLGAEPVLTIEGNACTGGEIVAGMFLVMRWDGGSWRIVSPLPFSWTVSQLAKIDIQTFDASGTWNAPAGFSPGSRLIVQLWGGGAGGGPFFGGAGGAYECFDDLYLGFFPSTLAVVVGAGGAGSDNSSPGNLATPGAPSYFAYGLYDNFFRADGAPGITGNDLSGAFIGPRALPRLVTQFIGQGGVPPYVPGFPVTFTDVFFGGAGGAQWDSASSAAGVSIFGGNGGATGSPGVVPGGGGGCFGALTGTGFAGAHGRVRVITIQ